MTRDMHKAKSVRYIPENWLRPFELSSVFGGHARPLEVDVGCGRGRFLMARAKAHPDVCLLGIERLLARVGVVDRMLTRAGLTNVRLLYADAAYAIRYLLPAGSVRAFFILFSDPWPKHRHASKRLMQRDFLDALAHALEPGGAVHIAGDHERAMAAVEKLFSESRNFKAIEAWQPCEEERTDYEAKYIALGRRIRRLSYQKLIPIEAP